jgi:hypothetical protein
VNKWLATLMAAGVCGLWLGAEAKRRREQFLVRRELDLLCKLLESRQEACILVEQLHAGVSLDLLIRLDETLAAISVAMMRLGRMYGEIDLAAIERIATTREHVSEFAAKLRESSQ